MRANGACEAFAFRALTGAPLSVAVLLVCVGTLLLYFVIGMICGFSLKYCRSATGNTQSNSAP